MTGEVEDELAALEQRRKPFLLTQIHLLHAHVVFDARDVRVVAAALGNQRVDEQNVCPRIDERTRERAADESEAPVISARRP
jgi:hypothetical protein